MKVNLHRVRQRYVSEKEEIIERAEEIKATRAERGLN